jgi:lysyl-tRNA synthetase class 2
VYPHKFEVTSSFQQFIENYSGLKSGENSDKVVSIAGRVYSKRAMGKNLRFFDIKSETLKIQVMANQQL